MTDNSQQDLTNGRFNKLTVSAFVGARPVGTQQEVPHWKCKCDCGGEIIVSETSLCSGESTSCGCIQSNSIFH